VRYLQYGQSLACNEPPNGFDIVYLKEQASVNNSFGDTSRRTALKTGLAMLGIGLITQAHAQDAEKLAQTVVQYQATPKGSARCSLCVNFEAPNACKIVVGPIVPQGWCVAFAPKAG
jgi:hypothetical protein